VTRAGLDSRVALQFGALDLDVSVTADRGELVVLVGPNGAGKSTVLHAIAGLRALDAGFIELDGVRLDDPAAGAFVPARERAIGVVFQDRLLFDHLTVAENVAFGLRSRGLRRRAAQRTACEWLERFGLGHLAGNRPPELSGGEAQRVALGRALAFEPRLLLLDEPFAALDATTRVEVRRELRSHLATLEIPQILVTHDPIEAITLADRIVVLEAGRVVQTGTADDLRTHPRSRYVADLLGVNLLRGTVRGANLDVGAAHSISVVNGTIPDGPATGTIHPRAITLHLTEPEGSARNVWSTSVQDLDDEGERIRVRVGAPIPLAVEITPSARSELSLQPGAPIWISFKATDVGLETA
jgi:molybdate transport system ATP-binding protein